MRISRNVMVIGVACLFFGFCLGMFMGGSSEHSLAPLHAHINLLGFTLMTVLGLVCRVIPAMGTTNLARAHFWLHLTGSAILPVMLSILLTGRVTEAVMAPLAPLAELLVLLGVICFAWNLWRNAWVYAGWPAAAGSLRRRDHGRGAPYPRARYPGSPTPKQAASPQVMSSTSPRRHRFRYPLPGITRGG